LALFCIIARAGPHGFRGVPPVGEDLCSTSHDQTLRIHYLLPTIYD